MQEFYGTNLDQDGPQNLEKNYSLMKFRTDINLKPDKVKIGEIDKARNRT
jgi:hypothetical protein